MSLDGVGMGGDQCGSFESIVLPIDGVFIGGVSPQRDAVEKRVVAKMVMGDCLMHIQPLMSWAEVSCIGSHRVAAELVDEYVCHAHKAVAEGGAQIEISYPPIQASFQWCECGCPPCERETGNNTI